MMSAFDDQMDNLMSLLMATSWEADKTKGLLWRLTRALPPAAPANDRCAKAKAEKPEAAD
jgi:hypothetical protein